MLYGFQCNVIGYQYINHWEPGDRICELIRQILITNYIGREQNKPKF